MRRISARLIMALILICALFGIRCYGQEETYPTVTINGEELTFDVNPIIEQGRTLVPLRAISQHLGYNVLWDEQNRRVEITDSAGKLEIFIDETDYIKDGQSKKMDVGARIVNGRTLVPLRLVAQEFGCTVRWQEDTYTAEIIRHRIVRVSSAKELLEAFGSHTKIILSPGEYNLSAVSEKISNPHLATQDTFDGKEYIVFEASDLIIEGENGKEATIVVEPRYSNVLGFMYCENVTLKNITAGHTIEPGTCMGGVIRFDDCINSSIENCNLYGCGTYGVIAAFSDTINITDTEIYECTYGISEISHCENILFDRCVFRDSEEFSMFAIGDSENVGVHNSVIKNNRSGEYFLFIDANNSHKVHFKNCEFKNNSYYGFSGENVYFENCKGIEN